MKETADVLFEYLKNILYDPDHAKLDIDALPEEFRRFGEGMRFLSECVRESRTFAKAMAKGDLSKTPPSGNNVLAAPVKELQNSLRHLAWQTQQVAKGDYSQSVDFMGEFSQAFNTMTAQLKERQESLIQEKQIIEAKNLELERNLELVMALTNYTHNMIFIYSVEGHELLFSNDAAKWFLTMRPQAGEKVLKEILDKEPELTDSSFIWELEVQCGEEDMRDRYFGVESYQFSWRDRMAVVHILTDDTERKNKENLMTKLAYADPLTGLNNRRYAMDLMKRWMNEKIPFVISFVDIDYLKYCNDTLGHKCGDEYLTETANALKSLGGVVCRIGGDEFIILQTGISAGTQDENLDALRSLMQKKCSSNYPQSFSYASCEVPESPEMSLEDYIKLVDTKMYEYKVKHKIPLKDMVYRDDRI
ncbi:MAG: diguanylate cyclase [Eubacteriales bacterium]|nr:diguanylate cyclase [Eubacteriales bacterium]